MFLKKFAFVAIAALSLAGCISDTLDPVSDAALKPRDNLAVQTAVIGRASAFVGTCGALAWLAPMLGVDTTAVFADARFLHGHLQVARRVYQVIDGGRFSPLDISAFEQLGLSIHP